MSSMEPTPEFSRPFMVDRLGKRPADEALVATPEERARLAKRFGLIGLDSLTAAVRLSRRTGDIIHVEGRLQADVVQECVVTLAPFPSHVEDGFELDFGSDTPDLRPEIELDMEFEPPEPIENGIIDLGELVAQHLSLALDPYPRAPGAELDVQQTEIEETQRSPFAVLAALKPRGSEK